MLCFYPFIVTFLLCCIAAINKLSFTSLSFFFSPEKEMQQNSVTHRTSILLIFSPDFIWSFDFIFRACRCTAGSAQGRGGSDEATARGLGASGAPAHESNGDTDAREPHPEPGGSPEPEPAGCV